MPTVTPEKLIALQGNAQNVRNICILAHVDHGKTSLTDALIATNGIISPKMAGKIRYLDSRPDEQLRGITMESSAISLSFSMAKKSSDEATPVQNDYLINLIDSPGHVDFSSEVSTASRLCDGAVILVDAVEGVCSQTVTVLREAWTEHLKPLLVINKVDRLITELRMNPGEAYIHLSKVIEQVNAVLGSFFQGERMEEDLQWRVNMEKRILSASKDQNKARTMSGGNMDLIGAEVTKDTAPEFNDHFEERDDENLYFAPENHNVVFSSAADGWAFTIRQFARLYEKKLGINRSLLEKVLWGDYYLEPKSKRILSSKHLKGRALKPMFVQLVLDNIWAVYEATVGGLQSGSDPFRLEKITKSLGIVVPPHIKRSKDTRALLTTVFSGWLPLSTAVLVSVVEQLPSPPVAQATRFPDLVEKSPGARYVSSDVKEAMVKFKTSSHDPVVGYVSKMISVPFRDLPENNRRNFGSVEARRKVTLDANRQETPLSHETSPGEHSNNAEDGLATKIGSLEIKSESEQLIGFCRLYSGRLSVGDSVFVLPPKFSPANPHATPQPKQVVVKALYLLMGKGLEILKTVPAGVVFGIAGLEGHILKSGTLCSRLEGGVNLAGLSMGSEPIVRVALEPVNPRDLGKMIDGLRRLQHSDACARYEVLENGEHVILGAGELHLERCIKDLTERFARCEVQAGEPIVPYRESVIAAPEMAPIKNSNFPRGTAIGSTASKQITIRLRVRPLPSILTDFLERNSATIRKIYLNSNDGRLRPSEGQSMIPASAEDFSVESMNIAESEATISLPSFKREFQRCLAGYLENSEPCLRNLDEIVAFGPRRIGPNILVDSTGTGIFRNLLGEGNDSLYHQPRNESASKALAGFNFTDAISHAFQLSTSQGPLCSEPMQGVGVFLEQIQTNLADNSVESTTPENTGRLAGEIIKTVRDCIRQGFLNWSPRLLLAMYSCEIQASTDVIGRVYGVITRRRGRILSESMKEGTPFFTITALLPVAESFGFSDEIRKRTSGAASPQLRFQGFEMLDEDPFWVPFTEDELEDLGDTADRENVAKKYMDHVRRRKGLLVRIAKTTEGEKGRTLKK